MKRSILIPILIFLTYNLSAQTENPPAPKKKDWTKIDLSSRAADHFMLQLGYAGWGGKPDSINTTGIPRTFNFYLLFDFPFKTNPHMSVAIGAGIGTDNIYFEETKVDIINPKELMFTRDTANKYKKMKLNTVYAEVPLEIRWSSNPENMNRGFKVAIGAKVGLMTDAKVKAKVDRDIDGNLAYTYKEKSKRYFNNTRLAVTGRLGWGNFSVFGSYNITEFVREGFGPPVKPWSIGLTISGL